MAANKSQPKSKPASAKKAGRMQPASAPVLVKGKIGALVTLMRKPEGASIAAMMTETGWQAHSVRGAIAGSIKKKLGLTVTSFRTGETRLYRIDV